MYQHTLTHTSIQWPRCCYMHKYSMKLHLRDYDDATGASIHRILKGHSYTITGTYDNTPSGDYDLIWCIDIVHCSNHTYTLLELAVSEYIVDSSSSTEMDGGVRYRITRKR